MKEEGIVRLTVIGCGYVGLVTGACLAAAGHEVYCTDIDENRIKQLNAGKVPIYEQHLEEVLKRAVAEKKIFYTTDAGEAIRAGEVIFICVGTPPKESGAADLSAIDHVARQIATEARTQAGGRKKHRSSPHWRSITESSRCLFSGRFLEIRSRLQSRISP
jgi:nucleotide sugar dehydrogenase